MGLTVHAGRLAGPVIARGIWTTSGIGAAVEIALAGTAVIPVSPSVMAVSVAVNVKLSVCALLRSMFVLSSEHPVVPASFVSSTVLLPVPESVHMVNGLLPGPLTPTFVAATGEIAAGAP